jgi:hypothetical protein
MTVCTPTNVQQELERWMPGIKPGEVPDTPVLYQAGTDPS